MRSITFISCSMMTRVSPGSRARTASMSSISSRVSSCVMPAEALAESGNERPRLFQVFFELPLQRRAAEKVEPQPVVEQPVIADHDVVEDRQREREARALEGARDARGVDALRREPREVFAAEARFARGGRVHPGDDVEESGLPRAVRTDQAEDRALPHF